MRTCRFSRLKGSMALKRDITTQIPPQICSFLWMNLPNVINKHGKAENTLKNNQSNAANLSSTVDTIKMWLWNNLECVKCVQTLLAEKGRQQVKWGGLLVLQQNSTGSTTLHKHSKMTKQNCSVLPLAWSRINITCYPQHTGKKKNLNSLKLTFWKP